jgi:hypothetical protein
VTFDQPAFTFEVYAMQMQVLKADESPIWMQVLERCERYDFYHLPQYHALAEESNEGTARLFVLEEEGQFIALPLLLRPIASASDPHKRLQWFDATSVYGYAGPVATANVSESLVQRFHAWLEKELRALHVVSVFSRMHPTLRQKHLLAGLGEFRAISRTVAIDLTLPVDEQRAAFRKNHKEGINKLRRAGISCQVVPFDDYTTEFIEIYYDTMRRVGAVESYFFSRAYFHRLQEVLGERFNLFVCTKDGRVMCGGIFVETCGIVQYHLGGTATDFLKTAPMKLLVDEVRLWATHRGQQFFHLGGGANAKPDDPLLHFKVGFSDRTHEFAVWRWILAPEVYADLCAEKELWNEAHGMQEASPGYFPRYRAPTAPSLTPSGVGATGGSFAAQVSMPIGGNP